MTEQLDAAPALHKSDRELLADALGILSILSANGNTASGKVMADLAFDALQMLVQDEGASDELLALARKSIDTYYEDARLARVALFARPQTPQVLA